jgi:hypothetical protein
MSKKLSELFNLPSPIEDQILSNSISEKIINNGKEAITNLEKIDNALSQVHDLDLVDDELDDLSSMAITGYKDLCDLASQVDSRYSGELFTAAGTMFGHALEAKKAKITKKLKTIELQLKKAAIDVKEKDKNSDEDEDTVKNGSGRVLDRNEILKIISKKNDTK